MTGLNLARVYGWTGLEAWLPRCTDTFSVLVDTERGSWLSDGNYVTEGDGIPTAQDVADRTLAHAVNIGLEVLRGLRGGREIVFADGHRVRRRSLYVLAKLNDSDVTAAAHELMADIVHRWGRGQVAFVGKPGYLVHGDRQPGQIATRIEGREVCDEDGERTRVEPTGDGSRRVLLGCYYVHRGMPHVDGPALQEARSAELRLRVKTSATSSGSRVTYCEED